MRFECTRELTDTEKTIIKWEFNYVEKDCDGTYLMSRFHPRLGYTDLGLDDIDYLKANYGLEPVPDEDREDMEEILRVLSVVKPPLPAPSIPVGNHYYQSYI